MHTAAGMVCSGLKSEKQKVVCIMSKMGRTHHQNHPQRKKTGLLRQAGYDAVIIEENGMLQTTECYNKVLELIGPATLSDTFCHTAEGGIVCST